MNKYINSIVTGLCVISTCLTADTERRVSYSGSIEQYNKQREIVRGNDTIEYPNFRAVGMILNRTTGRYASGVLIKPDVILTAAHVFKNSSSAPDWREQDIKFIIESEIWSGWKRWTSTIVDVRMHPGWTERLHAHGGDGDGELLGSDIAIAYLDAPLHYGGVVQLPQAGFIEPVGSRIIMAGWGAIYNGADGKMFKYQHLLMGENTLDRVVPRVSKKQIAPELLGGLLASDYDGPEQDTNTLSNEHGTIGYIGSGDSDSNILELEATTCIGDSGSPLFMKIDNSWVLIGINSYGTHDYGTYGDISVWMRVESHLSWINHHLTGEPWIVDDTTDDHVIVDDTNNTSITSVTSEWIEDTVFGTVFMLSNGWMYQLKHGWMYTSATYTNDTSVPTGMWVWREHWGWMWTGVDSYPHMWSHQESSWIHMDLQRSDPTRTVYHNYRDGCWYYIQHVNGNKVKVVF